MALVPCPHCGKSVSDKATACVHCGGSLVEADGGEAGAVVRFCPECGERASAGAEVCSTCGYPLGELDLAGGGEPAAGVVATDDGVSAAEEPCTHDDAVGVAGPVAEASEVPGDAVPEAGEESDGQESAAEAGPDSVVAATDDEQSGVEDPAQPEDKAKSKNKKIIGIVCAVIAAIVLVGAGVVVYHQQEEARIAREQAEAEAAARKKYNAYVDIMTGTGDLILSSSAKAESAGNTITNVWHSAIWKHDPDEWDDEIRQFYADDFNDALKNLFADQEFSKKITEIKTEAETVDVSYATLQGTSYEQAAKALESFEKLYDNYKSLVRTVTNPSGNYNTFSSEFRKADTDALSAYESYKARIPSKV